MFESPNKGKVVKGMPADHKNVDRGSRSRGDAWLRGGGGGEGESSFGGGRGHLTVLPISKTMVHKNIYLKKLLKIWKISNNFHNYTFLYEGVFLPTNSYILYT